MAPSSKLADKYGGTTNQIKVRQGSVGGGIFEEVLGFGIHNRRRNSCYRLVSQKNMVVFERLYFRLRGVQASGYHVHDSPAHCHNVPALLMQWREQLHQEGVSSINVRRGNSEWTVSDAKSVPTGSIRQNPHRVVASKSSLAEILDL